MRYNFFYQQHSKNSLIFEFHDLLNYGTYRIFQENHKEETAVSAFLYTAVYLSSSCIIDSYQDDRNHGGKRLEKV